MTQQKLELVPLNGLWKDDAPNTGSPANTRTKGIENGTTGGPYFDTEYPADTAKCLAHMCETARVAQEHHADLTVLSGGPAHPKYPEETEAAGGVAFLKFCKVEPAVPVIQEGYALCTPYNVLLGPAAARRHLGSEVSIGVIVVWTLWLFKANRYDMIFEALGLRSRAIFLAHSDQPRDEAGAKRGEEAIVRELEATGDWLMLGKNGQASRRRRYAGSGPYENFFDPMRAAFRRVFAELDGLKSKIDRDGRLMEADYRGLQRAYRAEVLCPGARSAAA